MSNTRGQVPPPPRDEPLARFQAWLICESAVRAPIEQFATWHHLHRLRRTSVSGQSSHGLTHSALARDQRDDQVPHWLHEKHQRSAATCRQQDIDEWLATGPTTRTKIRTFVV